MAGENDSKVGWVKIFKDFLSVRSVITLGAFWLAYNLMYRGWELPAMLNHIIDILLGFWFGEKIAKARLLKGGMK